MIKTVFVSLAVPPAGFLVLIVIGQLLRRRWPRTGSWLTRLSVIALLLCSLPLVSLSALVALESGLPTTPPSDHPPQAIIVLGAEALRDRQEPIGARVGPLTLERLRTAAALHRRTGLPILVTGGTVEPDVAPVGLAMEASLRDDFRTPARWVEAKSYDTWENARFSADILRPEGINSVYVVTQGWHMKRALLAFEGTGLTVTAAPTPPASLKWPHAGDFMPRGSSLQQAYYAFHEVIGLIWYRLR